MNVIAMMSFVGLALVAFFVAFFIHQINSESGAEQDALMPLNEETPHAARKPKPHHIHAESTPDSIPGNVSCRTAVSLVTLSEK